MKVKKILYEVSASDIGSFKINKGIQSDKLIPVLDRMRIDFKNGVDEETLLDRLVRVLKIKFLDKEVLGHTSIQRTTLGTSSEIFLGKDLKNKVLEFLRDKSMDSADLAKRINSTITHEITHLLDKNKENREVEAYANQIAELIGMNFNEVNHLLLPSKYASVLAQRKKLVLAREKLFKFKELYPKDFNLLITTIKDKCGDTNGNTN